MESANIHRYHAHTTNYCFIFLSPFYQDVLLYVYTVSRDGGYVDRELNEYVMIERVEMIARLTSDGTCQERDREIALNLIAEITRDNLMKNKYFPILFLQRNPQKERE